MKVIQGKIKSILEVIGILGFYLFMICISAILMVIVVYLTLFILNLI